MRPWTVIIVGPQGTRVEEMDAAFDAKKALNQIQENVRQRNENLMVLAILPGMFKNSAVIAA